MSSSVIVQSFLRNDHKCSSIVPSIWNSASDRGAPIWVRIPFTIDSSVVTKVSKSKKNHIIPNHAHQNHSDRLPNSFISPERWEIIMQRSDFGIGNNAHYSSCVNGLSRALGVSRISYSSFKSVRASSLLFW